MRKFGPKLAIHPSIGTPCPACQVPFIEGDYTTLALLGPGADKEARKRCADGRAYNAVAVEVHWECSDKREAE